jgi:methylmalonyl-CoA mutase N-terminal domain/subunit
LSHPRPLEEVRRWRDEVLAPFIARRGLRRSAFRTDSGLELADLYSAADLAAGPEGGEGAALDLPGEYPFTRGIHPTMYRGRLWTMRQYAGFATAEASNARYRYLLDQGQTGLSIAFDLPTQMGYDPDDPLALGEVGRVGVSIASLADMETLLAGIPLDRVTTSMTINATAAVLLALYVAVARKQGLRPDALGGTTQNDILKEYVARGTYIFPPRPSMRLVTDVVAYATECVPRWHPISVSGYHIREAGATAAQEIAFTLADAVAYVEAACERGLEPDAFLPRLSFFFAAQNNLLEEAAKFRAARRLWASIARDRFGARDPESLKLRFHTQTAGVTLTAQQPLGNVVRVTVQALAAVLGGTQSLHTNAYDEALGLPTEESATLALRTQQILAHESGVADVVDPLGGSFAVETLTDRLAEESLRLLGTIDAMGGALRAIESGWVAARIADSAYASQRAVESGDRVVVGVNAFTEDAQPDVDVLRIDPELDLQRRRDMERVRSGRDSAAVHSALRRLGDEAAGDRNLMGPVLEAVEAYATMGEICAVLRGAFGEYRAPTQV